MNRMTPTNVRHTTPATAVDPVFNGGRVSLTAGSRSSLVRSAPAPRVFRSEGKAAVLSAPPAAAVLRAFSALAASGARIGGIGLPRPGIRRRGRWFRARRPGQKAPRPGGVFQKRQPELWHVWHVCVCEGLEEEAPSWTGQCV